MHQSVRKEARRKQERERERGRESEKEREWERDSQNKKQKAKLDRWRKSFMPAGKNANFLTHAVPLCRKPLWTKWKNPLYLSVTLSPSEPSPRVVKIGPLLQENSCCSNCQEGRIAINYRMVFSSHCRILAIMVTILQNEITRARNNPNIKTHNESL